MKKKIQRRSRKDLSLSQRVRVIKEAAKRKRTKKELARLFKCCTVTIRKILLKKDELLDEYIKNGRRNSGRRPRSAVAIKKVLTEWIHRARAAQIPVTDGMIIERARQSKSLFKHKELQPDKRWVEMLKKGQFDGIDLKTPDPKLKTDKPKSLKLSDIYNDMKGTLSSLLVRRMKEHENSFEYKMFLKAEKNYDWNLGITQTSVSNADKSKIKELASQLESCCEADTVVEIGGSVIKTDAQALKCIKRLEEFSMLKGNYRAIGLIEQLEQLYKGQIEE